MRFGVVLEEGAETRDGLASRTSAVEDAGLALVWLRQGAGLPDPFVQAAATGTLTSSIRVGVEVEVGQGTPVYVAEAAAVADLATNGRLVLGLRAAPGTDDDLAEAVGLVLACHRSRPFRHDGPRWPTPANLSANTFLVEERLRVTPAPAQLALPTWVVDGDEVGRALALPVLSRSAEAGATHWGARDDLDAVTARLARPLELGVGGVDGGFDHGALAEHLHGAQRDWGCDTVLVRLPDDPVAWARALDRLARLVVPRVQLDRLPPGLIEHWDDLYA